MAFTTTYAFTTTAALTNAGVFESADLVGIKLAVAGATAKSLGTDLGATISDDKKTVTIPGYGTLTATGTDKLTFTANSSLPTGDYTFADTSTTIIWDVIDLTSATAAVKVTASANNTKLITGSGADSVTGGAETVTITSGAGNDTITSGAKTTTINAGDGNDEITHNQTIAAAINGGAGNDKITLGASATNAANIITLGDGDDTLIADAAAKGAVSGGIGADVFDFATDAAVVTVSDYSYAQGDKVLVDAALTGGATLNKADGVLTANKVKVTTGAVDNVYKAKLNSGVSEATKQEYWTAVQGSTSVTMDGSAVTNAMFIDATGAANAVVQGGTGADTIDITGSKATVTVGKGLGADSVTGFNKGFDGDVLNLSGVAISDVVLDASTANTVVKNGATNVATLTGAALTDNSYAELNLKENGGTTKKVAIATGTGVITSDKADADVYVGGSAKKVTFAAYDKDNFAVNLNDSAKYVNITDVVGAKTGGTYIGSTNAKVDNNFDLSNATKASQVWGGGKGTDKVTLKATNDVQDLVWFGTADGKDEVTGFKSGFGDKKDVLYLYDVADVTSLKVTGTAGAEVAITSSDSDNIVTVKGVVDANKSVQLQLKDKSNTVKKVALGVAATATIDAVGADVVIGQTETTGAVNTVKYGDTSTTDLIVNLQDTSKYKNIHHVDLAAATGANNVVVGSADTETGSNVTLGGAGTTNQVWGGSKAADNITVAGGKDTIWFGANDGKDVIAAGFDTTNDKIKFYDKSVSEIASGYTYAGGAFTSKASDKDVLTVTGLGDDKTIAVVDKTGTEAKAVVGAATLTYNKDAKVYMGATGSKLNVASASEVVLYLGNGVNGTVNDIYFSGVTEVDASGSAGNTVLIGSASKADKLTAGNVTSALWGGGIGDDTLVGNNSGVDQFWFGTGDGVDAAQTVDKGDKVVLYNLSSIDDIKSLTVATDKETIALKDGSTLSITDTGNTALNAGLTFQVGTGTSAKSYTYNTTTKALALKA